MEELGIYIHIPFCIKKCYYCDFISYSNKEELIDNYIKKLLKEIKNKKIDKNKYLVTTIYIGGGTPSYIEVRYIKKILDKLKKSFNVKKNVEITIELNPNSAKIEKLKKYLEIGINRLSIGMQTQKNEILKTIGRSHTYEDFLEIYKNCREIGFKNINIDNIIGLPGQTLKDVEELLNIIEDLKPEHVSIYSLIIEDETKLKQKIQKGEIILPNEKIEREMYWILKKGLESKKYLHYEISNFAKKGLESKHNLNCWNQKEYIGFGIAAHSYIDNKRYSNTEDIKEYIEKVGIEKENYEIIHEIQTQKSKMKENMLLGLRKIDGIKISEFKKLFISNPLYLYKEELNNLVKEKLLKINVNTIKLTKKGMDLANLVWEKFI